MGSGYVFLLSYFDFTPQQLTVNLYANFLNDYVANGLLSKDNEMDLNTYYELFVKILRLHMNQIIIFEFLGTHRCVSCTGCINSNGHTSFGG